MKIKLVDTQPIDPREFDLPEKFSPKNIEDIAEIFHTPMTGHYNCCLIYTSPSPRDRG